MRHLIVVFNSVNNKESGFNLFELIIALIIISILTTIAVPNLLESHRQQKVNEAFTRIRQSIIEAQLNANRQSLTCTINITSTKITASPSGCILENITVDDKIVEISSNRNSLPLNIPFSFKGTTSQPQTLQIQRKDFSGKPIPETGKCIVISSIGMIRTGIYDQTIQSTNCNNIENKRYDNSISS